MQCTLLTLLVCSTNGWQLRTRRARIIRYAEDDAASLQQAADAGACARCVWAHFSPPGAGVRYLPPFYDARLFDRFATRPAERTALRFMQQQRSHHRQHTETVMRTLGYEPPVKQARAAA